MLLNDDFADTELSAHDLPIIENPYELIIQKMHEYEAYCNEQSLDVLMNKAGEDLRKHVAAFLLRDQK